MLPLHVTARYFSKVSRPSLPLFLRYFIFQYLPPNDHADKGVGAQQNAGAALNIFFEKIGLTGHQTVYGMHYETDNYHLHIVVNRVKPETEKVVLLFNG